MDYQKSKCSSKLLAQINTKIMDIDGEACCNTVNMRWCEMQAIQCDDSLQRLLPPHQLCFANGYCFSSGSVCVSVCLSVRAKTEKLLIKNYGRLTWYCQGKPWN